MSEDNMYDERMIKLTKAAYLMVKGSLAEDLNSKQELMEALQFAGILRIQYNLYFNDTRNMHDT